MNSSVFVGQSRHVQLHLSVYLVDVPDDSGGLVELSGIDTRTAWVREHRHLCVLMAKENGFTERAD